MFQLYKKIYDDFIDDDHDQSVSITALTVQVNRLVSFFFGRNIWKIVIGWMSMISKQGTDQYFVLQIGFSLCLVFFNYPTFFYYPPFFYFPILEIKKQNCFLKILLINSLVLAPVET